VFFVKLRVFIIQKLVTAPACSPATPFAKHPVGRGRPLPRRALCERRASGPGRGQPPGHKFKPLHNALTDDYATVHPQGFVSRWVPLLVLVAGSLLLTAGCQPAQVMETHHLAGGAWTTYRPQDWAQQFRQKGEWPHISSIVVAPDGTLWFGTDGGPVAIGVGAYHFDGKAWTHITRGNGLPFDEISSMAVAQDGAVWFGSFCCGAARFDGRRWSSYTTANGLAGNDVRSIALAPDGALWFGTADQGAARFDGEAWQTYTSRDSLWGNYIGRIFVLPDRSLLFSSSTGSSAKLNRFDGQAWTDYPTPWTEAGKYTTDMVAAPNGELWFSTENSGVYRRVNDAWQSYSLTDGLPSNGILCSAVAPEGSVWFGTGSGVARFDGKSWTAFNSSDGVGDNWVTACALAPDGSLWFGYTGGIARYVP
jgi:ligand-binding sensor domain-containing protein